MTGFRIQTADRDVAQLLATDNISFSWYGPEAYDRPGVSACRSLDELAFYLANSALPYGVGEWVIVEMDGYELDVTGMDAEYGEILIQPTEIISVRPMDAEFFELIGAAYDAMEA